MTYQMFKLTFIIPTGIQVDPRGMLCCITLSIRPRGIPSPRSFPKNGCPTKWHRCQQDLTLTNDLGSSVFQALHIYLIDYLTLLPITCAIFTQNLETFAININICQNLSDCWNLYAILFWWPLFDLELLKYPIILLFEIQL